MESVGIVRKVDDLGRVVIPSELRRTLDIDVKDPVEFFSEGDKIILKKYKANMTCAVTGEVNDDNHVLLDGKLVLSNDGVKYLLGSLGKVVK